MKKFKINRSPNLKLKGIEVFYKGSCLIFKDQNDLFVLEDDCEGLNYNALMCHWKARPLLYKVLKMQKLYFEKD